MAAKLTPKQEAFVREYLKTGNASEAYRRAYNATNMKPQTIGREATRLLADPLVTTHIGGLQKKAEAKALLSFEEHMEELKALREQAKQEGQISAAIQAEVKRGELRRFYVKQTENGAPGDFEDKSEDQLAAEIASEAEDLGLITPGTNTVN